MSILPHPAIAPQAPARVVPAICLPRPKRGDANSGGRDHHDGRRTLPPHRLGAHDGEAADNEGERLFRAKMLLAFIYAADPAMKIADFNAAAFGTDLS